MVNGYSFSITKIKRFRQKQLSCKYSRFIAMYFNYISIILKSVVISVNYSYSQYFNVRRFSFLLFLKLRKNIHYCKANTSSKFKAYVFTYWLLKKKNHKITH